MVIAVLTVEYHLHGNDSLKGKRRVANSLKQKVRNTFNVAIAEYGTEDSLTRLRLMVISLSNSEQHLQSRMDKCLAMMEAVCSLRYSDLSPQETSLLPHPFYRQSAACFRWSARHTASG